MRIEIDKLMKDLNIFKGDEVRIKYPNKYNNKRHYNRLAIVLNIDNNGDCKVLIKNGCTFKYNIHWLERYNGSQEPTTNEQYLIKTFGKEILNESFKALEDNHFTTEMLFRECEKRI